MVVKLVRFTKVLYVDGERVRVQPGAKLVPSPNNSASTNKPSRPPQTPSRRLDTTLLDLEHGETNTQQARHEVIDITPPPQSPRTIDQDRTLTFDEVRQTQEKPAYYDPKTHTAYTNVGIFLAGMGSPVRHDVDPTRLDTAQKVEFYLGRAAGEFALGEVLGLGAGEVAGRVMERGLTSPNFLVKATKLFSFGSRHPNIIGAVKGALAGAFIGSEAAKGYVELKSGKDPLDVAGDIGSDLAFWGGVAHGLSTTAPRVAAKQNRFLEGKLTQIDVYRGKNLKGSVKVLSKQMEDGALTGVSVYKPGEGTVYRITEGGSRTVDLRMANRVGAELLPTRQSAVMGEKFLKASTGGETAFSLYDPPRLVQTQRVRILETPGFRSYLNLLRPTPLTAPRSAEGILIATGAADLVDVFSSRSSSSSRRGSRHKNTTRPVQQKQSTPRFIETSENMDFAVAPTAPSRNTGREIQIPRILPSAATTYISREKTGLSQGQKNSTLQELSPEQLLGTAQKVDFGLGLEQEVKPSTRTKTITGLTELQIGGQKRKHRRPSPALTAQRYDLSLTAKSVLGPGLSAPNFSLTEKKKKKKHKPIKNKAGGRSRGTGMMVLGEIDLLSQDALDFESDFLGKKSADKAVVSVRKFNRLWSTSPLGGEPLSMLTPSRKKRSRKKSGRRGRRTGKRRKGGRRR